MNPRARTVLALAVLCGCGGGDSPRDSGPDPRQQVASIAATPNRDLDLLFVIDDSGSMADKQNNFAASFAPFVNVLSSFDGGLPNLHIGVVSTDMGTKGMTGDPAPDIGTVGSGGCGGIGDGGALQTNGAPVAGTFLSDIQQTDGSRLKNYTGELATVFTQMATLGATGCGFEQPLHAMKVALQDTVMNAGFLRQDATLGIVFLADEDDCSAKDATLFDAATTSFGPLSSFRCTRFGVVCAGGGQGADQMNQVGTKTNCVAAANSAGVQDIAPFVDFVTGLKADRSKLLVAGMFGPKDPVVIESGSTVDTRRLAHSCTYDSPTGPQVADPGVRFASFLDVFSDRGLFTTICQQDFSAGLQQIGDLVGRNIGSPCLTDRLRDVEPRTPGIQIDCIVEDVVAGLVVETIPECGSSESPPCWRLDTDPQRCPLLDMLKLVVLRETPPDPRTITNMRCRIMQ